MSSSVDGEHAISRDSPTTAKIASTSAISPGPWRASSLSVRGSPSLVSSSTFKEQKDHPQSSSLSTTNGMTTLRPSGTGAWVSPSKRVAGASQSERNGSDYVPPVVGSFGSFSRSTAGSSPASSSTSSTFGVSSSAGIGSGTATGMGAGMGAGMPSSNSSSQQQPLTMEALAAKFAGSKPPALAPVGIADKERRSPMGSFTPSSSSPLTAHIKVQRTASLNHNSHSSMFSKGTGSKLQPGHLAQPSDMRRTASHNNAFSTGLGASLGSNSGGHDFSGASNGHHSIGSPSNPSITVHHSGNGTSTHTHNTYGGALGGASGLAPFSLSQMTRSPRRSSLNPSDPVSTYQQDHSSPVQSHLPSSSVGDKHPLQHTWTLYYDITSGYGRQGSSLHNYENGLRDMGSFTTVELFARYFNWIEKPHKIENSANYHLFKDGIKPMWEDPANANGGRWIVTLSNKNGELLDRCWMELAYALVGEQLDAGDDICGAVLSRRTKADRLAVWVRDKDNVEAINGIGKRLIKILGIAMERISLEFQVTTETRSTSLPRTYISLETIRKELAQEATVIESNTSKTTSVASSTPSLIVDSTSTTPASATDSTPITPSDADKDKGEKNMTVNGASHGEKHVSMGKSGLLISVNGNEDLAGKP